MATAAAKPSRKKKARKLSRIHKPDDLSLSDWQIGLRRQYARDVRFDVKNLGANPVFSEFAVTSPDSKRSYRVAIRGRGLGVNYCACPDYRVNTLGTCKHIEFLLQKLDRKYARQLDKGPQASCPEVFIRYGAERQIMFEPGEKCPPALRRLAAEYFREDGRMKPSAFAAFDGFAGKAREIAPDLRIYDDALELIAEVRDSQKRKALLQRKYGGLDGAAAFRKLLKVSLHPYQRDGALFAASAGRAIIADEMGLGKTIQAIAAAEILARECGAEQALIVCPASLKYQWQQEIARFSDRPAIIVEGLTHQRRRLYGEDAFFKIVNYEVVHRDLDTIAALQPDLVILDEAQRIKNWQTRTAKSVKQLESTFAIVLTGTPLENRLEELHSITEFVDRCRLGPLFAFKAAHEICEPGTTKVVGYRDLGKVTQTLAPILIRRTKNQVLKQLPPRMDKNFFVPMTKQQWVPHDENRDIVAKLVHKWRRFKFLSEKDQLRLRIALQNMRMSCDSTYLLDKQTRHGTKVDELCQLLGEIFEDREAKVVIFSQWLRMNELVEEMLEDRKWGHVHLHGGVPSRERSELTRALREEPDCRVFLSTDAGGTGLNLQRASCVINMDIPWNPAVLEQRIGRVHRMGQGRPVRVVNFISEHTIEHGMLSLLAFKRSVFAGVLDGAEDKVFMGDSAMNRFMKTVESATTSIPEGRGSGDEYADRAGDRAADQAERLAETDVEDHTHAGAARPRTEAQLVQDPLAALLGKAGELLSAFAQGLQQPATAKRNGGRALAGRNGGSAASPLSLEADPKTGRAELRIALPDEAVLRSALDQLAGFLGALAPRP